jgi:hypothetical protein
MAFPGLRRSWRDLPLSTKVLTGGAAASLPVLLLLVGTYFRASAPDSPYVHPPDEIQAIYWNGWASTSADPYSPTRRFETESDCKVFLDLSGFDYSSANSATTSKGAAPEFVRILKQWLKDSNGNTAKVKILFLPDPRFFDSPKDNGVAEMVVDLVAVRKAFAQALSQPSDLFQGMQNNAGRPKLDWLFARATLELHTRKLRGPTSIGISIWDGIRPVDEMAIPMCIGSENDCRGMRPPIGTSLRGFDSLRLSDERSAGRNTYPDGALHFLELNTGTVIGVFHRNDWVEDRFLSWRLQDNSKTLRAWLKDKLIPAFNVGGKREELTERGRDLFDRLFPDDLEGQSARKEFQRFFSDYRFSRRGGVPGSLFVRMLLQDDDPLPILPIGLMAVQVGDEPPEFLGLQFRLETPLESQDYRPAQTCVSNWVMLLPLQNSELANVRDRVRAHLVQWQNTRLIFDDIPHFRDWARNTDEQSQSTVLATLSHHDRDRLYFSSESIMSTGFHRQFANPSIAILAGCGTGNIGATDIVRALNHHGVAAMIVTSSEISPILGADFLSALDDTLSDQPSVPMSLELAMFKTLQTLATSEPSKTSGPYGPSVLAFALLGNGNFQICAASKKGELR